MEQCIYGAAYIWSSVYIEQCIYGAACIWSSVPDIYGAACRLLLTTRSTSHPGRPAAALAAPLIPLGADRPTTPAQHSQLRTPLIFFHSLSLSSIREKERESENQHQNTS